MYDLLIHTCCCEGDVERLNEIIAQGVNVNEPSYDGYTLLHCASCHDYLELEKV